MEVRITFRSEIFIKGENLEDINEKWDEMDLYSKEAIKNECGFIELMSVEDTETYEDLEHKFSSRGML